jgi:acetoin utilization protein AcuC
MPTTAIIYSDEWRQFDYGREHPLRMERLGLTWKLMEAYGLTALPHAKVLTPEAAPLEEIARFHTREYIEILRAVSAGDWVPHATRYGLGPGDNPIFPGLWEAAQLAAGGSLLAAQLVATGEADRAFHFAGGLHHANAGTPPIPGARADQPVEGPSRTASPGRAPPRGSSSRR